MNKRLVALGVAMALVVVILLVNVVFNRASSSKNPCQDFIAYIMEGNAKKSYGLLSQTGQDNMSENDWKKQVDSLKIAYLNGTTTKKSSTTTTSTENNEQQQSQTREVYEIKSGSSKYSATCFITDNKIDAFDSQPIYE